MTWARIDDAAPLHPKNFRGGIGAFGFDVAGICYCNRNLTDGFVPVSDLPLVFPGLTRHAAVGLASRLVEIGRWEKNDDRNGYLIHDYHHYQPTSGQVRHDRDAARERKERWKERRRNGVPNANGAATEQAPVPEPVPEPVPAPKDVSPGGGTKRGRREPPPPPPAECLEKFDKADREFLEACPEPYRAWWLHDPEWWISLRDGYQQIHFPTEASRYMAHVKSARKNDHRQGLRNWIAIAEEKRLRRETWKAVR